MPTWTIWLIIAVFATILAYLAVNEVMQRRSMRSVLAAADTRVRRECDIATGPDGEEYAVLKPECRPPLITVQQQTPPPATVARDDCPNCGKRQGG